MRFSNFLLDGYRGKKTKSEKDDYYIIYIDNIAQSIHNKYNLIDILKKHNVSNIQQSVKEILKYIDNNTIPYTYINNGILSFFDKK